LGASGRRDDELIRDTIRVSSKDYAAELVDTAYFPDELDITIFATGTLKDAIANDLSENAGISYAEADTILSDWATTSNKTEASQKLQLAASEYFGTDLSDWQKSVFPDQRPYKDLSESFPVIDAVYQRTQDRFRELGYSPDDYVTLYRGIKDLDIPISGVYRYQGNVLESWSVSPREAKFFGDKVLIAEIPVSSIWSTSRTGPGSFREGEFIIINSGEGEVFAEVHWEKFRAKRKKRIENNSHEDADWIKSVTAQREGGDTLVVDVLESSDPKSPHVSRASFNQLLNGAEWVYDIHGNEVAPEDGPFRVVEKESHAE
jgi:hypothetical protein